MNALELSGVSRSFGDFALRDVSFTLPGGCILGLVGENGAGKTTLIRLIMNAMRRDSGEIRVLGVDNTAPAFRAVKEDVGVVLDESRFPEQMNAREVEKMLALTYRNWDSGQFQTYLKQFDLPERKIFKDFSRGMKMKLAIAAALSHTPKLLILDEATSGLDPIVRDEIVSVFADLARDEAHSVLISSHIVSDLEKLCDYVAFLHKGQLALFAEKDALLDGCGILNCTDARLAELAEGAVIGAERSPYGVRALVRRDAVPERFELERPTLEDVVLFQANKEVILIT